jgi:hypothetical protein
MQLCGQPTLAADKDQESMKNPEPGLCLHPKVALSCCQWQSMVLGYGLYDKSSFILLPKMKPSKI